MGVLAFASPPPAAHAFSNSIANSVAGNGVCAGTNNCGLGTLTTTANDLIVVIVGCEAVSTGPMSLSDATGNVYTKALGMVSYSIADSGITFFSQAWYASSAIGTSTGAISLTLSASAVKCISLAYDINIATTGFLLGYSSSGIVVQDVTGFGTAPNYAQTVTSTVNSAPANTFFLNIAMMSDSYSYYFYAFSNSAATPLVTDSLIASYSGASSSGMYMSTAHLFSAVQFSGNLAQTITGFGGSAGTGNFGGYNLAFGTGGTGSSCGPSNAVQTTTNSAIKLTAGSTKLVSNQTYANVFFTTGVVTVPAIQVDVKSVASAPSVGTKLTLAIYLSVSLPPSGAAPASLVPLQLETWTLFNNANPQNFTMGSTLTTNANTYVWIVLTTTHNGVTAYNSTTPDSPTHIDSSDPFSNQPGTTQYKVAPVAIQDVVLNQKNIALWGTLLLPCVTSITQTLTQTSTATNTGGGGGAVSNLGNLTLDVIVILGPALLVGGFTRSVGGVMLGAVMGVAVGYVAGLPNMFAVMVIVGIALVAMIFLGRGNQGGV